MKIILFFLSFCICNITNAAVFYISPGRNDATGSGSAANPWKTLFKATSAVAVAGDIIHVNSGTYLETQQCALKPGVSIEGDGVTSVLQSTLTADWTEMLRLYSAIEGTNGNQHIRNIKFDGQNLSTYWAIQIIGRSNVEVDHITMVDFKSDGIFFDGRTDNTDAAPTIYATGNSFHDNIVNNCAGYNLSTGIYGRGAVRIGGQLGFLLYNNTITQNSRPNGYNGFCIKYSLGGFNKGLKIYNNIITKIPFAGVFDGDNGWTFCMEMWHCEGGMEIYNNNFQGSLDLVQVRKRSYAFGTWIHDNIFAQPTIGHLELGIYFEIGAEGALVEHNTFDKLQHCIEIYNEVWYDVPRIWDSINIVKDVTIRNNLFTNLGGGSQAAIAVQGAGTDVIFTIDSLSIYNNTLKTLNGIAGQVPWVGVFLNLTNATGHIKRVNIQNNIFVGFPYAYYQATNSVATFDTLILTNNLRYQNGNSNNPLITNIPPTVLTNTNNIIGDPLFVGGNNYTLQANSPAIDAGIYLGLPFAGAAPDKGYAEFSTPLPIKLLDLFVADNKGKNLLQWKTATEINSDHFTIERSANGINFETLGTVNAAGYSSTELGYSFTDANPLAGINYYRLIMADKDKTSDYSNVVSITVKKAQTVNITSVQLSSGRNNLSVAVNAVQNEKALLMLFDANGRNLLNTPVVLQSGLNRIDKSTGTIAKGIYYVKLVTAAEGIVKNVMATE